MFPSISAALVTPVDAKGNIEHEKLVTHIKRLLKYGCDGVVLFGTTGESASFGVEERSEALDFIVNQKVPASKVVVGTGCCSVEDSRFLSQHAIDHGCAGVLVHPPFFFPNPSDDGIFEYFNRLLSSLSSAEGKVFLYHFPEITGAPITENVIEKILMASPGIVGGVKDSTGSLENMISLVEKFPELKVLSGDDHLLWPLLEAGGYGSITATANLTPSLLLDVKNGWKEKTKASLLAQEILTNLWEKTLLTFPVSEAVKQIIADLTLDPDWTNVCPPLEPLSAVDKERLLSQYNKFAPIIQKYFSVS